MGVSSMSNLKIAETNVTITMVANNALHICGQLIPKYSHAHPQTIIDPNTHIMLIPVNMYFLLFGQYSINTAPSTAKFPPKPNPAIRKLNANIHMSYAAHPIAPPMTDINKVLLNGYIRPLVSEMVPHT